MLREPFLDFNFKTVGPSTSYAGVLAAIFEGVIRPMIKGPCPGYLIEAHAMGQHIGKTVLARCLGAIISGESSIPAKTLPPFEDERRKQITSILLDRPAFVHIDNLKDSVNSASLDTLLTSTHFGDRVLGESRSVNLPNRATWVFTANAARLDRDLARRLVTISIGRSNSPYKHDPLFAWLISNLDDINRAALIIARAWLSSGRPTSTIFFPSYEDWVAKVGGLVAFSGVSGLEMCVQDSLDKDTESKDWLAFLQRWWGRYKDVAVSPMEVFDTCLDNYEEFPMLIERVGKSKSKSTVVGRWLAKRTNAPLPGGFFLYRRSARGGAKYWLRFDGECDTSTTTCDGSM
jgi:hypothetical protein